MKNTKYTCLFLSAVKFWLIFDNQISITLTKVHFLEARRSLSKHANIHIDRVTPLGLFIQNQNCSHFELLMNQLLAQRLIIFAKWGYRSKLSLKLRAIEVATIYNLPPTILGERL